MKCHLCGTRGCSSGEPCSEGMGIELYDGEVKDLLKTAADVEAIYYCTLNRLEEIMEFSRRMGYKKLGIAFCVGFSEEAKVLGEILSEEFEVCSVCCKVSSMTKDEVGAAKRPWIGKISCNPAEQARRLDEDGCRVQHRAGALRGPRQPVYRHSKAPVTTLVVRTGFWATTPAVLYSQYLKKILRTPGRRKV